MTSWKIEKLRKTAIDDIPEDSRLLLEIDCKKLMQSDIHNKTYWVIATKAALVAGKRHATCGIRKRTQCNKRPLKSTRTRLGTTDVKKEIQSPDWAYTATGRRRTRNPSHNDTVINTPSKHKPYATTLLKGQQGTIRDINQTTKRGI